MSSRPGIISMDATGRQLNREKVADTVPLPYRRTRIAGSGDVFVVMRKAMAVNSEVRRSLDVLEHAYSGRLVGKQ